MKNLLLLFFSGLLLAFGASAQESRLDATIPYSSGNYITNNRVNSTFKDAYRNMVTNYDSLIRYIPNRVVFHANAFWRSADTVAVGGVNAPSEDNDDLWIRISDSGSDGTIDPGNLADAIKNITEEFGPISLHVIPDGSGEKLLQWRYSGYSNEQIDSLFLPLVGSTRSWSGNQRVADSGLELYTPGYMGSGYQKWTKLLMEDDLIQLKADLYNVSASTGTYLNVGPYGVNFTTEGGDNYGHFNFTRDSVGINEYHSSVLTMKGMYYQSQFFSAANIAGSTAWDKFLPTNKVLKDYVAANGGGSTTTVNLATTTNSTTGLIRQNSQPFIHSYGSNNFYAGSGAGNFTSTGVGYNTGIGYQAIHDLTTGIRNQAYGNTALQSLTTGDSNVGIGGQALEDLTTGDNNTAVGGYALGTTVTSTLNTALGFSAGTPASGILTGANNTFLGANSNYNSSSLTVTNATAVGFRAQVSQSNTVILGAISGVNSGTSVNVGIGTTTPSARLEVTGAGGGTVANFKLGSATLLGTPEAKAIENDGTNLYYTNDAGVRSLVSQSETQAYRIREQFDFFRSSNDGLGTSLSGTGATVSNGSAVDLGGHPGQTQVETGSVATNRAGIGNSNDTHFLFGYGAWIFETELSFNNLSDATDTYTTYVGFNDSYTGAGVDGAYFKYTHGTNSGKFQAITTSNSTATTNDAGVTVAANTWYKLRIEVNAAGTEAKFYINNALVSTITTNVPTGTGRQTSFLVNNIKSAGTNNRIIKLDYIYLQNDLITPR